MKKLNFIFVALLLLTLTNSSYAKTWRVNNTAGVVADFTDAQTCVNSASVLAGDTIHIEPSVNSYGGITVGKQLVIIGNGYFLTGANPNVGLQANTNSSVFSSIDFLPASAGSTLQGITVTTLYLEASNLLIRRNYIVNWIYLYATGNNNTISGNFFSYGILISSTPNNITISNNIFSASTSVSISAGVSGTFENNTCYGGSVGLAQFQVNNNIFWSCSFTPNNSVYFNNIGDGTQFGTANGNQQNVNMTNVFVSNGINDAGFMLKAGSPAIGAGSGGVDCGAYGGPNPYKNAGIPNVPTIYELTVPPTGTTNINVTISTRSNN